MADDDRPPIIRDMIRDGLVVTRNGLSARVSLPGSGTGERSDNNDASHGTARGEFASGSSEFDDYSNNANRTPSGQVVRQSTNEILDHVEQWTDGQEELVESDRSYHLMRLDNEETLFEDLAHDHVLRRFEVLEGRVTDAELYQPIERSSRLSDSQVEVLQGLISDRARAEGIAAPSPDEPVAKRPRHDDRSRDGDRDFSRG